MDPQICVIFNPAAGKRRAARRLNQLEQAWGKRLELLATRDAGHAEELAYQAAQAGFGVVAAAGGDGTVHEVANGLLRARRPNVRFGVLPIGSANDYAHSLDWEFSHVPNRKPAAPQGEPTRMDSRNGHEVRSLDVGLVRSPSGRERYFVCCLGLGLNGAVTLESRRIRRLQGMALYGLATVRALWYHYACPEMRLGFDQQADEALATLMLSVLVGRREGGFVLAPHARLDDGWLDFIHAGALSRWQVLNLLPRLALAGPPTDYPKVRQGRCRQVRVHSPKPLTVHIDGEFFCKPEDGVCDLEIDIVPGVLAVERFTDMPVLP